MIFCVDTATRDELAAAAASVDAAVDPVADRARRRVLESAEGIVDRHAVREDPGKATYKSRTTNRNLRTLVKIAA